MRNRIIRHSILLFVLSFVLAIVISFSNEVELSFHLTTASEWVVTCLIFIAGHLLLTVIILIVPVIYVWILKLDVSRNLINLVWVVWGVLSALTVAASYLANILDALSKYGGFE